MNQHQNPNNPTHKASQNQQSTQEAEEKRIILIDYKPQETAPTPQTHIDYGYYNYREKVRTHNDIERKRALAETYKRLALPR